MFSSLFLLLYNNAIISLFLTCAAIQSSEKYSRTHLRNTKPAQSLRRTFSQRNSWKKNLSDSKMVTNAYDALIVFMKNVQHSSTKLVGYNCTDSP